MKLIDKMVEYFTRLNKKMKRWQRAVSVLSAVVVFVTTYALILPAITLDVDTASTQAGIEVAGANEPGTAGTVFESTEEEEPEAEEPEVSEEAADTDSSEEAVPVEEVTEASESGSGTTESSEEANTEEAASATEAATGNAADAVTSSAADTAESVIADTASAASAASTASTEKAPALITESTRLTYNGNDYVVYADFDGSAQLPVGVELKVKEITKESDPDAYQEYYEKALEELKGKYDENTELSFARFYDITFVFEGQEIEPKGNVNIRIEYKEAVEIEEETKVDTVHFDKNDADKVEIIDSDQEVKDDTKVESVEFESDKFSVYGVIGTATITTKYLTGDGETYNISVSYGPDANIPDGAELEVSEITEDSDKYTDLYAKASEAVLDGKDASVPFARFFDISIVKDGEKIQPDAPVDVKITFDETVEANKNAKFNAVHITDEATDVIDVKTEGGESEETVTVDAVKFSAEGFSIYGVTYTVDFEYTDPATGKTYYFSLGGGDSINLTDLLVTLGIKSEEEVEKFVAEEVVNVEFSNPELVKVTHKGKTLGMFGAEDWLLESLQAFDTEETLTISLKNGEKIVVKVTDAQSADISNQLQNATISGTGSSDEGSKWKIENPSGSYSIGLNFAETNASDQFPSLTGSETELQLTYQLPAGLEVHAQQGQTSFTNTTLGITAQIPWELDANGKLTFKLDNTKKDYGGKTAYEIFNSAVDAYINLNINAKWDGKTKKLEFSDKVEKDVDIGIPTPGTIKLDKNGWIDQNTGKLNYKVTVKVEGGNVDSARIADTLQNAYGIKINKDSVKISRSQWPFDVVEYTKTVNDQGMEVNFTNLTSGMEYYIEYTADVDYALLDTDHDGKVSLSPNNTVTDGETSSEKKIVENVTFSNVDKSVGQQSDLIQEGDKYYRELEWTIKVNDKRIGDLGGSSLKDHITTQTPPMEYIGKLTVERTDANGNKTTNVVDWNSLPAFDKTSGWTYNFPAGEDKSSYVFTYKTRVDVTDLKAKATVKNEAEGKYGKSGKDGQVSPGEEAGVKKEFVSTENGQSTWKITLTVPSYGLDLGLVEEQVPSVQKNGKTLYDELVSYTVDESQLAPGEHFVKQDWNPKESGFTLRFYKDAGTQHEGFQATGSERKIEITIVTKNNEEWLSDSSLTPTHVNTAKFNYMEVKASKDFAKKDIKKKVEALDGGKTTTINGKEYLRLRYELELTGVNGPVSIDDNMNINGVIYDTTPNGDYNGSLYFKYYENWNWYGSNPVTVTQNGNGATFSISDNDIPKKESGEYYGTYKFTYIVNVPFEEAQKQAAQSQDLKTKVTNTVNWDSNTRTSDYEVSYDALDKKLLNEGEITGEKRTAKYQIKVNAAGATVHGGEAYLLTDTFSDSLAVDYSSIQFSDPDAVLSYEVSGNTISIWIEDGKPLTITYNAKVLGNGKVKITNEAKTEFDDEKVEKERDIYGGSEGGGSFPLVHLMKVDGDNAKIRLEGVKFILHSTDPTEEERLKGISLEQRTFTTDAQGKVDINTDSRGYQIYFNTQYLLVEDPSTVPEHYVPLGTTYNPGITFIIDKEGKVDWDKHQYYNGYTLQVKNWKKKGDLEVSKSVVSDEEADKSKEYSFELKLYKDQAKQTIADEITGTYGDVSIEAGVGTFTLKDGEKVSIKGIPEGIFYEVKETNVPEGMTVKYDGKVTESATGKIVYNETKSTAVVNTKTMPGLLKVKKTSDYAGADKDSKVYKLAVKNSDGKYVKQDGTLSDTAVWIEFKADDEKTWNNLTAGNYTVVEDETSAAAPGYKWSAEGTGVSVTVNEGDNKEQTVSNKYVAKSGKITIPGNKTLTGRDMKAGEFTFVVKEGDKQVATGTNAAALDGVSGEITFTEIKYGPEDIGEHTYTVTETTPGEDTGVTQTGTTSYTVKVKVEDDGTDELKATITSTPAAVSFTNEYDTKTTAKIEGKKEFNGEIPENKFKVQITSAEGTPLPSPAEAVIGTNGEFAFSDIEYPLSVMADVQADAATRVKTKTFTYTVSEVLPGGVTAENPVSTDGIKYDTTSKTVIVTVTYNESTGVMSAQVSPAKADFKFENEQLGNLKLTKTLKTTDPAGDPNKEFEFTITFEGEKAEKLASSYKAVRTKGQESTDLDVAITTVDGKKTATVKLKADESVEIKNLPLGVTYTVTEKEDPDYKISSKTGDRGTISKVLSEATFENERVLGELEVTKTVQLNGQNTYRLGKEFWVVVYSDSDATTKVAGPQKITIAADGTGKTTFSNLPVGTYYVYELTAENGTPITGATGTIDDVEYTITTDNSGASVTKAQTKGTASIVNNKTEKGTLTVNKETLYNEKPDETVSGKTIKIGLYDADQKPVKKDGSNWVQDLVLSETGTGTVTFPELDYGTYYAYELDDDGNPVKGTTGTINSVVYTVTQETKSVTLSHDQQTGTIKIINKTEEKGSLEVTKEIQVNGTKSETLDGTFEVALYKVEAPAPAEGTDADHTEEGGEAAATEILVEFKTITVTKGKSTTVKFENLEVGATYKVYEVEVDGDAVTKVGDQFGQYAVTYENQSVTIPRGTGKDVTGTKVINNIATKEVEIDKKWIDAGGSDITETIQNAEITVVLKNGDTVVTVDASGTAIAPVTLNGSETPTKWYYKWTNLPKYDSEGKEITYSVSETAAKVETNKEGGGTSVIEGAVEATADTEGKLHLTNTLPKTEVKAAKEWQDENGTPMAGGAYPEGAKVTFGVFAGNGTTPVATVELNGTKGTAPAEDTAASDSAYASDDWEATFANLPKYDSTGAEITYTIKETVEFAGFENLDPDGVADGGTIHNKKSTVTLKIVKVDSENVETKLKDAEFTLQEIDGENATITKIGDPVFKTTDENGETSFEKVKFGYYEVTETKMPESYILTGDGKFYVKVSAEGYSLLVKEAGKAPKAWSTAETQGDVISFTADVANKTATATVKNARGITLPESGGIGTTFFTWIGSMLSIFGAALLLMKNRKMLVAKSARNNYNKTSRRGGDGL